MSSHAELAPSRIKTAPKRTLPFGYIVIGLIATGIVLLLLTTASGGRYELEVGQVVTAPEKYVNKNVRVRGQIKDGSIFATIEEGRPMTRFTVVDEHGHELDIVSRESPPDNFEGGKSCIVEGKYSEDGHLESTRLTMKCPSKYEADGQSPGTGAGGLYEQYKSTPPAPTGPRS
jgi:cytochrome c-type biogenesis protein CcmE